MHDDAPRARSGVTGGVQARPVGTLVDRALRWEAPDWLQETLPFVVNHCERNGIPYVLKAVPGHGYYIERDTATEVSLKAVDPRPAHITELEQS